METTIYSCNDYTIFRSGIDQLYNMVRFVVMENYNHHTSDSLPKSLLDEIKDIYQEELSYATRSKYFIVRDKAQKMVGCIRVFLWDKQTPTPMHKIFHISPIEKVKTMTNTSFWHIGRFAISSSSGFSTVKLFKQLMALAIAPIMCDEDGYMLAETDAHLLKVMNALGIETKQIGNSLTYLASETIPVYSSKKGLSKFYSKYNHLLIA